MVKQLTEKQLEAKQEAIYKLFKKITNWKYLDSRPILKNINLLEDGAAVATDSHRLLRVENFHDKKESLLINGITREIVEKDYVEYPDTDRLIPFFTGSATVNVVELYELLRGMMKEKNEVLVKRKCSVLNIKIKDGSITMKPTFDPGKDDEYKCGLLNFTENLETNINPKYLLEGLLMFKQAKIKEVTFRYNNNKYRPFTVESEDIKYLITPIRVS